jgi:hypothetical protein
VIPYSTVTPLVLGVSFTSVQVGLPGLGGTPVGAGTGVVGPAVGAALPAAGADGSAAGDGTGAADDGGTPSLGAVVAGSVVACETGPAEQPASNDAAARTATAQSRIDMWWRLTGGGQRGAA